MAAISGWRGEDSGLWKSARRDSYDNCTESGGSGVKVHLRGVLCEEARRKSLLQRVVRRGIIAVRVNSGLELHGSDGDRSTRIQRLELARKQPQRMRTRSPGRCDGDRRDIARSPAAADRDR